MRGRSTARGIWSSSLVTVFGAKLQARQPSSCGTGCWCASRFECICALASTGCLGIGALPIGYCAGRMWNPWLASACVCGSAGAASPTKLRRWHCPSNWPRGTPVSAYPSGYFCRGMRGIILTRGLCTWIASRIWTRLSAKRVVPRILD